MQVDRADAHSPLPGPTLEPSPAHRATKESESSALPAGAQQTLSAVIRAAEAVAAALEGDSHLDPAANKPCCPRTSPKLKTDVNQASCLGIETHPGKDLSRIPGSNANTAVSTGISTQRSLGLCVSPDMHHSVTPSMDPSVQSSLHHCANPSRAPSAAMCSGPSMHPGMDPQMHPSKEPSATLCTDPSVEPQSGFMSNGCPAPSAISDFNLTFQLPPTLSQAPSPATDPNLGTGFDPKSLPTPVAKPTPKSLPTPVANPNPKSLPMAGADNSPNPLSTPVAKPSPKPLPTPLAKATAKSLSTPVAKSTPKSLPTPVAKPTPKSLSTPVADPSPSPSPRPSPRPRPSPSPSPGSTPEPATPLPRLRSFDLFLDLLQKSSMVSYSPKLMLNPSQPLAEAEHQSVSDSRAYHDLGTPPASAKPPPFTPPAGCSPVLITAHAPSADPKKGLNPHSVPLDCPIPGLLSDPSLDSWASTATNLTHNFESNSSQGFRCGVSTDLTDCPAPAQPPESSLGLKQVQRVGELPLGNSSQLKGELPKGSDLPKSSAHPMSCEQPTVCEFPKGNLLTTGKNLMGSNLTFPLGVPGPMGWGPSPVNRGPTTASAYPVSVHPTVCEKLCFGSLDDFLSSFAEPASVRVPSLYQGATGFAIMAEPLDQVDYLLRPSVSPGATVCAVVTPQPVQVLPTLGGSPAEASAQLPLPQCKHACSTSPSGVKLHNGEGAAASVSAEMSSAAFVAAASPAVAAVSPAVAAVSQAVAAVSPAVAAMSPAVGPSTPWGTTEMLYPKPREQLHAVSHTVIHSVADGPSVMAISAPFPGALRPDDSEMLWAKGPVSAVLQMAGAHGKRCHAPIPIPSCRQRHHHDGVAIVHCSSPSSEDPVMADEDDCSYEGCLAPLKSNELGGSCRDLSCTEQQALLDELVEIQVSMLLTCANAKMHTNAMRHRPCMSCCAPTPSVCSGVWLAQ